MSSEEISKKYDGVFIAPFAENGDVFDRVAVQVGAQPGDLMFEVAEKIAREHNLELDVYDFNSGIWSEPRDYKFIFSVRVRRSQDYDGAAKRVYEAKKLYRLVLKKLADSVLKQAELDSGR